MKSEVFFRSINEERQTECFRKSLREIDPLLSRFRKGAFVGIKMTVGDEKNTGYIKPGLVKVLVNNLKRRGARPFVFDTNVIYTGRRQRSEEHTSELQSH